MNKPPFGTFRAIIGIRRDLRFDIGIDIDIDENYWSKEFVHGFVINDMSCNGCTVESVFVPTERHYGQGFGHELASRSMGAHSPFVLHAEAWEYKPESLGMFTGIYDTEDKPIYGNIPLPDGTMSRGGDILTGKGYPYFERTRRLDGKQNYVAIPSWNGGATYHVVGAVRGISHGLPISEDLDELKIIGNAYENPELLEAKS